MNITMAQLVWGEAAGRYLRSFRDVDLHDDSPGFGEELAIEVPALAFRRSSAVGTNRIPPPISGYGTA
jgi:hypothetical protein